jgi:hypothetical protein
MDKGVVKTGKSKSYHKNIVCLESFWTRDVGNRLSVQPILELASKRNYIRSVLLTCNTLGELEYNLKIVPHGNGKGNGILYFAFHGFPGGIIMAGATAKLETIAEFMGRRFANWVVYFDSCETLKIEKRRVFGFMENTKALMTIGYKKKANWMDSSAIDLLVLDLIQQYKDMRKFWNRFRMTYRELVRMTGLYAFHRNGASPR